MIIGVNMTYNITFDEDEIEHLVTIVTLALQHSDPKRQELMTFIKRLTELINNRGDDLY